jgi:hypothetical protein
MRQVNIEIIYDLLQIKPIDMLTTKSTLTTSSSTVFSLLIARNRYRSIARFRTQHQMGMVFDILSGNRFPFLVESTIMHPPLSPD